MNARRSEIYVPHHVKSRLFMVQKLYPQVTTQEIRDEYGERVLGERVMTVDELASEILTEVIRAQYPLVLELEREIEKVEKKKIAEAATLAKSHRLP